ncbi:fibronectin type III domain-containing protein, partial [candidate division WWE3 bacterium]|nr:fibronectin type III domain-containing protein [candidate division WWE3 bacterium]
RFTVKNAVSASLLYGKTISYGGSDQIFTSTDESTYTLQLTNLEDNTTYHYQLELEDSEGNKYNYEDHVFTTLPRPRVSEVQLQQVSGTAQPTVLVTWQSNTAISSIVTYTPVTNTSLSKDEVDLELQEGEHRMIIRGLLPQTQYSLTVKGVDKLGNEAVSDPVPFTTASDTRPPQLTNLQVEASTVRNSDSGNTSAQLIVTWDSDELGTSQVEYAEGTGTTYTARTQEDDNLNGNHVVLISNLSPSNVYHLRAISRDSAGNIGYSGDVVTITPKAENSALDLVLSNLADIFGFLNTGGF